MNAIFKLDDERTIEIGADLPRSIQDNPVVGILITRTPIDRAPRQSSSEWEQEQYPALPQDAVFYGPHPCDRCGCMIVKASQKDGGQPYDYPDGPIYPNTRWEPHRHRDAPAPKAEYLLGVTLKPSYARAIASALLSAATEARQ